MLNFDDVAKPATDERAGRALAAFEREAPVRRSDQHPVHLRHHRRAERRDAHPSQHRQQRLLHRRSDAADARGPAVHPGALLSLLRHGAGNLACVTHGAVHGEPVRRRSTRRDSGGGAGGAMHRPARRADDVHRHARASRVRPLRLREPCAPGSWRARPARSRSCGRSSSACTCAR